MSKNIDFIRIDSDVNFYNTSEQVRLKNTKWFIDDSKPSELSGSYKAVGFFSKTTSKKRVSKGPSYVTSSTVTDSSGTSRKILAGSNDYLSGSVNDAYKQGVEISQEKHWTAGLAKITAGTPGHIHYFGRYGISDARIIIEEDYFSDLEVFDPVNFVSSGGTYDSTARYPLFIKSDFNQPEKLMLDGTIEPFPIRSVVSNFTNNVPFEPRSFKGQFGNGNINWRISSDQVLSLDYKEVKNNKTWYIDDHGTIDVGTDSLEVLGNASVIGYVNYTEALFPAFIEDGERPRGYSLSDNYSPSLSSALSSLPPGGSTYVSEGQISYACGYTFDNASQGTDSIAYGGLLY